MIRFFPSTIRVVSGDLPFVFEINTANTSTGSSTNTQFRLPLISGVFGVYDFIVNWGDSTSDTITVWDQEEKTHTYGATGTYTITITGKCEGWRFGNGGDRLKIIDISQWGIIEFQNNPSSGNDGVFYGCSNLNISAIDNPVFLGSITAFFRNCSSLVGNSSFNNWDVTPCTAFTRTFEGATIFNQPIGNWDTSNIESMNFMFTNAPRFNQPIGNWDVKLVVLFNNMFQNAFDFNQNIGAWDVRAGSSWANFFSGKTAANYSAVNLDAIYNGWSQKPVVSNRIVSFNTVKYTAAGQAGKNILTGAPNNWSITDGGI